LHSTLPAGTSTSSVNLASWPSSLRERPEKSGARFNESTFLSWRNRFTCVRTLVEPRRPSICAHVRLGTVAPAFVPVVHGAKRTGEEDERVFDG
jgi:hypothetical protein